MNNKPLVSGYVVITMALCLIYSILTEVLDFPVGASIVLSIWIMWGFALLAYFLSHKE